jgi:hypothetical protein
MFFHFSQNNSGGSFVTDPKRGNPIALMDTTIRWFGQNHMVSSTTRMVASSPSPHRRSHDEGHR